MNLNDQKHVSFNDGIKLLEGVLSTVGAADTGAFPERDYNNTGGMILEIPGVTYDERSFEDPDKRGMLIVAAEKFLNDRDSLTSSQKTIGLIAWETIKKTRKFLNAGVDILRNLATSEQGKAERDVAVDRQAKALLREANKLNSMYYGNVINAQIRGQQPGIFATSAKRDKIDQEFDQNVNDFFGYIWDAYIGSEKGGGGKVYQSIKSLVPQILATKDEIIERNVCKLAVVFSQLVLRTVNCFYEAGSAGQHLIEHDLSAILPDTGRPMWQHKTDASFKDEKYDFSAASTLLTGLDKLDDALDGYVKEGGGEEEEEPEAEPEPEAEEGEEGEEESSEDDDENWYDNNERDIDAAESMFNKEGVSDDEYLKDVDEIMVYEKSVERAHLNALRHYMKDNFGEYADPTETVTFYAKSFLSSLEQVKITGQISNINEKEKRA